MLQHDFSSNLKTLSCENIQLLQHIDYLEERLSQYENVPTFQGASEILRDENPCVQYSPANEWNVWPYSWATAAWQTTTERFHSFHRKLQSASTTKQSPRVHGHFRQAHCDDAEVTLM